MNSLPISVIVLAHQADQRFDAAIASVNWAAEIIVIWTGTREGRPNVKLANLQILFFDQRVSDFAHLRNAALQEAQHDWVFFLDSDEVFDQSSLTQLQKVITNPLIDGASIHRRDIFLQKEMKHGEVGQVSILRLVKRKKAQFERKVHEVAVVTGEVAQTNIRVYHFSHRSISDFLQKVIFYIQLEKIERQTYHQKFRLHEMLIYPPAKFLQNYFFRLGFLDGWRGLIYATMMSVHSFGVRAAVFENQSKTT